MPLTQELSLEKNLAILFKSPPELNIGKQYPVRLKQCLAFCGLGHFMTLYDPSIPHECLFYSSSSSSTSDKDSVTEEAKENQQINTTEPQANEEELRKSKALICGKEEYGDIMPSSSDQPQINEENIDNKGTFNSIESSVVAESQVDKEVPTNEGQLINEESDPEVKQPRKRSHSPKEPERFKATLNDSELTFKRSKLKTTQSACKNSSENSKSSSSKSGENKKVKTKQTPIYFSLRKPKEKESPKKWNVDLDATTSGESQVDIEYSILSNNGFHSLDTIITLKEPQTPCNGHLESKFNSQVRNEKEIPWPSSKIPCCAESILEHICERTTPNVDVALSEVAVNSQIFMAKSSDVTFKSDWQKVLVENAPDLTDRINQLNIIEPQANMGELQTIKEPIHIKEVCGDIKTSANDQPQINKESNDPKEILNFIEPSAVAELQVYKEPPMNKEQLGDKKPTLKAKQTRKRDRSSKEAKKWKTTLNNNQATVKRRKTKGTQSDRKNDPSTKHLDVTKVDLNCNQSASKEGKLEGAQSSSKKSQEKLTTRPSKSGGSLKCKTERIPERPSLTKSTTGKGKKLPKLLKVYLDETSNSESDEGDENTVPIKCKFYISRRFSKTPPTIVKDSWTPSKEQLDPRFDSKFNCGKETKRHSLIKTCPECAKQHICKGSKVENSPQVSKISSLDDLLEWDCRQNQKMLIENAPNSKVASLLHNMFELKKQNKELQNEVTRLKEQEAFYERFNESISKTLESMEHYKAVIEGDSPPIITSSRMNKRMSFEKTSTVKQDQNERSRTDLQSSLGADRGLMVEVDHGRSVQPLTRSVHILNAVSITKDGGLRGSKAAFGNGFWFQMRCFLLAPQLEVRKSRSFSLKECEPVGSVVEPSSASAIEKTLNEIEYLNPKE
ncbi:hypothetical protein ACTXT7_007419 [Hymenolepis weldensis]